MINFSSVSLWDTLIGSNVLTIVFMDVGSPKLLRGWFLFCAPPMCSGLAKFWQLIQNFSVTMVWNVRPQKVKIIAVYIFLPLCSWTLVLLNCLAGGFFFARPPCAQGSQNFGPGPPHPISFGFPVLPWGVPLPAQSTQE